MIVQLSSAISNSGINFTNSYNENITFVFITASFFGGCLISSTSGFKISRILIIFNKIYYELLKLLTPSAVINSTIFRSGEKIEFKDFHDKFKKNKQKHIDTIIEYRVPEAHNILNGNSQTLGVVNSNFSGNGYTDYMEAFDQSTMIDDSVPIKQMTLEEMKKN